MIDKKIKYAIQGGGPNYLGKQKMVKAPKKWKSSPDHPDTELAYITEPEKQVLIALNLHGGLEDGKPNRGPSGIISLQGDMGGWSGGGGGGSSGGGGGPHGGGGGGGGGGGQAAQRAAQQAAAQRAMQAQVAAAEKQQAAQAAAQRAEADRQQRVAQQAAAEKAAAQKTATAGLRGDDPDLDKKAWDKIYQKQNEYLKTVDANTVSQLELDKIANDTLHQMYLGTGKPATQDYQNIFQTGAIHQTPGGGLGTINPFEQSGARTAIPTTPSYQNIFQTGAVSQTPGPGPVNPFEQSGARTAIPTTPMRTRIQDERAEDIRKTALGNIALQTDKSLTDISDPSGQGQGQGIMSNLIGTGKKAALNFALSTLPSPLAPIAGLANMFFPNLGKSIASKFPKGTGTKTTWAGPNEEDLKGGDQNIVQASIEQFQPTDQQTAQMNEIMRKRKILQEYADKGQLNEEGMNTLAQMNQLINQFQVDPRSIYG